MPSTVSAADPAVTPATLTVVSNNASTTLAKVGNTLTYTLVISGTDSVPLVTPQIKLTGLASTTMTPGATRTYTYSTTTYSSGISDGLITFQMSVGASTGNSTTTLSQTNLTAANVRFDKTVPTISTITSTATASGALKVGDTITFTLAPGATEYGATVAGSYNGRSLTWSTANSGVSFTATYTVTEGDTDQATALQISSVVITDAAGNASSAGAGSDIAKTVDANSPATPTASPSGGTYSSAQHVSLSSVGASSIRYTLDDVAPTCSSGTAYAGSFLVVSGALQVIGCDAALNSSSIASVTFSRRSSGGGGGSRRTTPVSVTAPSVVAPAAPVVVASTLGSFTRDLFVGSAGGDVKALQVFLNAHGFMIAASGAGSPGHETTTFGGLTKAALAKFQAANGIPAKGRFGPMTRAAVSEM
ncbi:MAG: hypothetical protein JWL87_524 [Candidatus Adlerbacteria bacterium]|nr:hypothetical protein [Candidatus Adlerbacteria bacterium]